MTDKGNGTVITSVCLYTKARFIQRFMESILYSTTQCAIITSKQHLPCSQIAKMTIYTDNLKLIMPGTVRENNDTLRTQMLYTR